MLACVARNIYGRNGAGQVSASIAQLVARESCNPNTSSSSLADQPASSGWRRFFAQKADSRTLSLRKSRPVHDYHACMQGPVSQQIVAHPLAEGPIAGLNRPAIPLVGRLAEGQNRLANRGPFANWKSDCRAPSSRKSWLGHWRGH